MSSTSDTSAIDDKKTDSTTASNPPKTFFSNLGSQLLHLTITIFVGGIVLYSAKVSQSNIMPTDLNCEPYQKASINMEEVKINVDVVKMKNDQGKPEIKSTKIVFPYEENMKMIKDGLLGIGFLQKWKEGPHSSPFWIYLATIQQQMYANFATMMNACNHILHTTLPESVIIFLTPIFYFLLVIILGSINTLYGCILYFYNIYLLFSTKKNCKDENVLDDAGQPIYISGDNGQPRIWQETRIEWEYKKGEMLHQWYWAILYILLAFIFMSVSCGIVIPIISLITTIKVLILPLLFVANVVGTETDEKYTFTGSLMNILRYKMSLIMYIVSFFVVIDAFTTLGGLGLFFAVVACLFIYSFYPEIYKQYVSQEITSTIGLTPYTMPKKFCKKEDMGNSKCEDAPKSFIWRILKYFFSFIENVKEVKKEFEDDPVNPAPAPTPAPAPVTTNKRGGKKGGSSKTIMPLPEEVFPSFL